MRGLIQLTLINKVVMVSVSHHITKLILLNNIFEIKSIMVLGRIQWIRCLPVFMLENSIFWNFSIDEMIVISVFFKISIRKNFTHDRFRFILFNFFSRFLVFGHFFLIDFFFCCILCNWFFLFHSALLIHPNKSA